MQFLALVALLPLVSAHFKLNYPVSRTFNEDTLPQFPCGGQNTVNATRTSWPLTGGPIQLFMGHTSTKVQVLIALGNNPGSAFNTILVPTTQEDGPNNFCLGSVYVPSTIGGMTVTAGMNATIQVVSNGDPTGGLYNCADITFTATPLSAADYSANCMNSTGVTTSVIANAATINANGTTVGAVTNATTTVTTTAMSMSMSGTAAAAASTSHAAAAAAATVGAGILGAAGWVLAGAAGLL